MISNYTRPQLEVYQNLEVTQSVTNGHLAACIIGANYDIYKYEGGELTPTAFSVERQTIPFDYTTVFGNTYTVDLDSVNVYAYGMQASLATIEDATVDSSNTRIIRMPDGGLVYATNPATELIDELDGAPVSIGDIVEVTTGTTVKQSTVIALAGKKIPSSIAAGASSTAATGDAAPTVSTDGTGAIDVDSSSTYTGVTNTTYILTLTAIEGSDDTGEYTFSVTDTAGVDVTTSVTLVDGADAVAVGRKGLYMSVDDSDVSFTVGDSFSIACTAAGVSTTEFDGVEINTLPYDISVTGKGDTLDSITFLREFYGDISANPMGVVDWEATQEGVILPANLGMYVAGRISDTYVEFVDGVGSYYVEYKVLVAPPETEGVIGVSSTSDIEDAFGTIDPENELAYGLKCALEGSGGITVYAVRTAGTTAADFSTAVAKTESDDSVYSFVPLTDDLTVADVVVSYNNEMSTPTEKHWRRTIVGVDYPGERRTVTEDTEGKSLRGTFAIDSDETATMFQLSDDNNWSFINEDSPTDIEIATTLAAKGDLIELVLTGEKYEIDEVLSATELLLVSGPAYPVAATDIALWKADTKDNKIAYIKMAASLYNTRRALAVWSDQATTPATETTDYIISNMFLAAEIAGLSSAVVPQQSITNTEVSTITQAARMYTVWSQSELDSLAAYGILIVTQDVKDGTCFIRHQLTTETDKGNLYYEDSCTRNIDNISYAISDALQSFIGRANVTPTAVLYLKNTVEGILDGFLKDSTDELIGPSLVSYENLVVAQDSAVKDRVNVTVDMYLPLPMNNVRVYQNVYAAEVTI